MYANNNKTVFVIITNSAMRITPNAAIYLEFADWWTLCILFALLIGRNADKGSQKCQRSAGVGTFTVRVGQTGTWSEAQ